jgi:hypothetical protein
MIIVFQTKALADEILKEICCTPNLEGGIGPVILWWLPENGVNRVAYCEGADGRCLISHPFSEVDRDWFEAYMAEWITAGTVKILDAIPDNWAYGQEV